MLALERVARLFHQKALERKVLLGWKNVIGVTWRMTMERIVRREAEKQLMIMSNEYEAKLRQVPRLM